jgi:hypothetical protein
MMMILRLLVSPQILIHSFIVVFIIFFFSLLDKKKKKGKDKKSKEPVKDVDVMATIMPATSNRLDELMETAEFESREMAPKVKGVKG